MLYLRHTSIFNTVELDSNKVALRAKIVLSYPVFVVKVAIEKEASRTVTGAINVAPELGLKLPERHYSINRQASH